ncbi:unnamed protein product [Gordionus sp. m RMFG-2023]|uniref:E3 ubiquitin-protein ligase MARCHF6-like isoform X2 n=1 Tax=Gordionus sp. m RMFG-2023 TaxID=3053472 RepID=UPI0030E1CC5F
MKNDINEESDDICRVCRSEGSLDNPLFYPCVCHGTIKYVHQDCLVQWLKYSKKESCELCKHPFTFIPIYATDMPKSIPLSVIIYGILNTIFKVFKNWFHYTLVIIAWLVMVPFAASRIYTAIFHLNASALLPTSLTYLDSKQLLLSYAQGIIIVVCGLCMFMCIVWLKEQILSTEEINDWLVNVPVQSPPIPTTNSAINDQIEIPTNPDTNVKESNADLIYNEKPLNLPKTRDLDMNMPSTSKNYLISSNNNNLNTNEKPENIENHNIMYKNTIAESKDFGLAFENNKIFPEKLCENSLKVSDPQSALNINISPNSLISDKVIEKPLEISTDIHGNNLAATDNDAATTQDSATLSDEPREIPVQAIQPVQPAPALLAGLDIFNLNNIDWDRAVEDLTWENLLGLDGTYSFLEHALWIIVFNALFIFLFAFLPYHYGKLCFKVFRLEKKISNTNFDATIFIYTGYVLIAQVFLIGRKFSAFFNHSKLKMVFGVCYIIIKVCLLLILEIIIFPFFCGWFLDICSLKLFGSSFSDRLVTLSTNPATSALAHWLFGVVYVFYFASGVAICREALRPGIVWFLRASSGALNNNARANDDNPAQGVDENLEQRIPIQAAILAEFNPIKEMILFPVREHFRRFCLSWLMFVSLITLSVYVPTQLIRFLFPKFLPFNFISSYDSYFAELPLELVLFHVVIPSLMEQNRARHYGTLLITWWARHVGQLLGLTSYLLGNPTVGHVRTSTENIENKRTQPKNKKGKSEKAFEKEKGHKPDNDSEKLSENVDKSDEISQVFDSSITNDESQIASTSSAWITNDHEILNDVTIDDNHDNKQEANIPTNGVKYISDSRNILNNENINYINDDSLSFSHNRISDDNEGNPINLSNTSKITNNGEKNDVVNNESNKSYDTKFDQTDKIYSNKEEPPKNNGGSNNPRIVPGLNYNRPTYFPLRIAALIITIALTIVTSSFMLFTLPVFLGRLIVKRFPWDIGSYLLLSSDHVLYSYYQYNNENIINGTTHNSSISHINNTTTYPTAEDLNLLGQTETDFQDLYTALAGTYFLWFMWRYFRQFEPQNINMNQNVNVDLMNNDSSNLNASTNVNSHENNTSTDGITSINNHEDLQEILGTFWRRLTSTLIKILKLTFFISILVGCIPLLAGLLLDLCLVVPLRVPGDRTALILLSQDWMLGLLLVKSCVALSLVLPPSGDALRPELRRLYENLLTMSSTSTALTGPVWTGLAWPCLKWLGTALALPYVVAHGVATLFGLSEINRSRLEKNIYPSLLSALLMLSFLSYQIKQLKKLYQHIKDERYLIGKKLVNLERSKIDLKKNNVLLTSVQ